MRGMACATESHLCSFQGLFTHIPMRKMAKSPSNSAVSRFATTPALEASSETLEPSVENHALELSV
jgi:hypothetical protein